MSQFDIQRLTHIISHSATTKAADSWGNGAADDDMDSLPQDEETLTAADLDVDTAGHMHRASAAVHPNPLDSLLGMHPSPCIILHGVETAGAASPCYGTPASLLHASCPVLLAA